MLHDRRVRAMASATEGASSRPPGELRSPPSQPGLPPRGLPPRPSELSYQLLRSGAVPPAELPLSVRREPKLLAASVSTRRLSSRRDLSLRRRSGGPALCQSIPRSPCPCQAADVPWGPPSLPPQVLLAGAKGSAANVVLYASVEIFSRLCMCLLVKLNQTFRLCYQSDSVS